jgi:hypothetical protein
MSRDGTALKALKPLKGTQAPAQSINSTDNFSSSGTKQPCLILNKA